MIYLLFNHVISLYLKHVIFKHNCAVMLNKKGMLDEALFCIGTRVSHIFPFLLDIIYFIKIKYTKW